MLAPAIRVDAGGEPHIGTVVVGNNRRARVPIKLRLWRGIVGLVPIGIALVRRVLEPVRRILRHPASVNGLRRARRHDRSTHAAFVNSDALSLTEFLVSKSSAAENQRYS